MVQPGVQPIRRENFREIAASTIKQLDAGSYKLDDVSYDLNPGIHYLQEHTTFYPPDSTLKEWNNPTSLSERKSEHVVQLSVKEITTLQGLKYLSDLLASSNTTTSKPQTIGVLNFASAKNPGGGFIKGAQAQEESLARSSTLYRGLMSDAGQNFYRLHKKDPKQGYYSHAMIYCPRVFFMRDDKGTWHAPIEADVLVSAACNAGVVRRELRKSSDESGAGSIDEGVSNTDKSGSTDESDLNSTMKERMARILYLFESRGIRNLVLGSFGTGVFRNNVDVVAGIWLELLQGEEARFRQSFDHVVFAVIGASTFETFKNTFDVSLAERLVTTDSLGTGQ